jgi:hypothetical protein
MRGSLARAGDHPWKRGARRDVCMRTGAILACVAGGVCASAATADELYRQNPVQSFSGLSSQDARNTGGLGLMYVTADNFPGQAGWTITGLEFWGGYPQVQPGNTQGFMVRFYADAGGAPGAMLSTQDVMAFTETQFYVHPSLNWPGYHYTLTLNQPFAVPGAGQYWVATVAILDFGGGSPEPQWGWVAATTTSPPLAHQSSFGGPFTQQFNDVAFVLNGTAGGGGCYANCDNSTAAPVLNVADFTCFLQRFAAGESYANCDGSTAQPVLNVADFTCFLQRFAAGCP